MPGPGNRFYFTFQYAFSGFGDPSRPFLSDAVGITDAAAIRVRSSASHSYDNVGVGDFLFVVTTSPRHPSLSNAVGILDSLPSLFTAAEILTSLSDSSNAPLVEVTWSHSGNQKVGVNVFAASTTTHYDSHQVISDNYWHSYAVSLDLNGKVGNLFVDGRTALTFPIDSSTWPQAGGRWFLGAKTNGSAFFDGSLDEFNVAATSFSESMVYQTNTGIFGTTLNVAGSGVAAVERPMTTVATVASLMVHKVGVPLPLRASTAAGLGATETVSIDGQLTIGIPVAPISVPQNYIVTTTASASVAATTIQIAPLTVALPTSAVLYFAGSVLTAQLTVAANIRDTTLTVAPLAAPLSSGATGTGINPAAFTVTTSAPVTPAATTVPIASNPQVIPSGSTLFFTSSPTTPVMTTTTALSGATSIAVAPLAVAIPAAAIASGSAIPAAPDAGPPLGPGTGVAPPAPPGPSPVVSLQRVSLRFPAPTVDANGYPT